MIRKIIDDLTGNRQEMLLRYSRLKEYDAEQLVLARKNRMLKMYILFLALMLTVLTAACVNMYRDKQGYIYEGEELVSVLRDEDEIRTVRVTARAGKEKKDLDLVIEPGMTEETAEEEAEPEEGTTAGPDPWAEIEDRVRNDPARKKVTLPAVLSDGTKVSYERRRDLSLIPLFAMGVILFLCIYTARFDSLKKAEKRARESVSEELPGFISKLELLLASGTVVDNCFRRIIEEHRITGETDNYFYQRLAMMEKNVRSTNSSYIDELAVFARESGVHEFIRLAGILEDGVTKGVDLTEKLENEGRYLWFSRKNRAEEMGKLADTKLTLPLVILLLSLVIITIAPAMLKM